MLRHVIHIPIPGDTRIFLQRFDRQHGTAIPLMDGVSASLYHIQCLRMSGEVLSCSRSNKIQLGTISNKVRFYFTIPILLYHNMNLRILLGNCLRYYVLQTPHAVYRPEYYWLVPN